jgi:predicted dehydrogenase
MDNLTVALLGIEHPHSLAHLATLQQLPEVERILLWDTNAEALERARATQGAKVVAVSTDLDTILADPRLFACLAAVRNDLGPDIFLRVINAGKHLMAEKPVGRTAADAARIVEAARRAGVQLGVCYQNRYIPAVREARDFVRQGLIGPLISVEMRLITTQVQFRDPKHWLFRNEHSGGGILSWLGCHYIDMMRFLTGEEIVSVAAEVATRSGENIDVEDVAALSLRFESGAVGTLHCGYMLAQSGGGYHNRTGYDTYVGVNGRLGRFHWTTLNMPSSLTVETVHPAWSGAPQRVFQYAYRDSPAYGGVYGENFMRDFFLAAQGKAEAPTRGEDALAVARVVDAAYESSRTGRRITLA